MKSIYIIFISLLVLIACKEEKKTRIYGSLKDFKMDRVTMNYQGEGGEVYSNRDIEIVLDSVGSFDLGLTIIEPTYYTIGQNHLYIMPGDEIKIDLGRNREKAIFEGSRIEENNYLKGYAWGEGERAGFTYGNARSFDEVKHTIDSLALLRKKELDNLQDVSSDFREKEEARIKAQQLNGYFSHFLYGGLSKWDDTPEVKKAKKITFYTSIKDKVEPLLNEIAASDDFLQVPDVRKVLLECKNLNCFQFKTSETLKELTQTVDFSNKLDNGIRIAEKEEYDNYAKQIKNPEIQEAYLSKLEARSRMMEGKPAIDFNFDDIDGNSFKLSDFKGKPIFVDFWATWCLPCLAQMPYVKELSKEYPNIQFIAVSIDQDINRWKQRIENQEHSEYIKEFITDVYHVGELWDINMIPRFLMIDKDFKIAMAFAPRPSNRKEIEELFNKYDGI